jgi:hypothetical protein
VGWFLPATSENIAQYLVDHAEKLAINTLRQRLAALAQWHIDQGFPDPTKAPSLKKSSEAYKGNILHKKNRPNHFSLSSLVWWIDG